MWCVDTIRIFRRNDIGLLTICQEIEKNDLLNEHEMNRDQIKIIRSWDKRNEVSKLTCKGQLR